MPESNYEQQQIDRVLAEAHAIDQIHHLKVASGSTKTETKWLNVTTDQLKRIRTAVGDTPDTTGPQSTAREHLVTIIDFAHHLLGMSDEVLEGLGEYIQEADDALTDALNDSTQP